MPLDPKCKAFLDEMVNQQGKPFEEMNLEEVQARCATRCPRLRHVWHARARGTSGGAGHRDPGRLGGRADLLASRRRASARFDVLPWRRMGVRQPRVGGWPVPRALANASECIVVSVDYRLAPEHRYPTAAEDCYAITKHVGEHPEDFAADPSRIAVAGDSAGGNLAAVVCQMARDRGGPLISYQLLVYPCVDYLDASPSMTENAQDYFLTRLGMNWFWNQYADVAHAREPYLSPLQAKSFAGLPPAMVFTAEYDPLRDQGELYARRLSEAGVPVTLKRFDGMIHGFFVMGGVIEQGGGGHRAGRRRCGQRSFGCHGAGALKWTASGSHARPAASIAVISPDSSI